MDRSAPRVGVSFATLAGILLCFAPSAAAANRASPAPAVSLGLVAHATAEPGYAGLSFGSPVAPVENFLNATASGGIPPYAFAWDFGDNSSQRVQDAIHVYFSPGLYIARVTVKDSGGRVATSTVAVGASSYDGVRWVTAMPAPALGSAPLTVRFAVTGTGEMPSSYAWSFGDGGMGLGSAPAHTYASPGVYVASLTAGYPGAQNASSRMTVIVDDSEALDALATSSIVGLCYQESWNVVHFHASVGGAAYAYRWDFGEGNASSTEANPSYSYQAPGFYHANLTVVDAHGKTATSSTFVVAAPPPCPPPAFPVWPTLVILGIVTVTGIAAFVLLARRLEKRRSD